MILENFYKKMYLLRKTEETIEKYFEKGVMRGTTHGYIGQEVIAVAVLKDINLEKDYITSGHRCHGHYLALTEDVLGLAGEIMGKNSGIIYGKGASQHIQYKNFYTNGITGGMIPIAVGIALSKKIKKEKGLVISFLGDGAMNEGYVLESFNLAKIYNTPNIFILENNHYSMSTDTSKYTSGTFEDRIKSFGIYYKKIKALDPIEINKCFNEIYNFVSKNQEPYFIEFETFRFCGHSKSDKKEYFDKNLEDFWLINDPLKVISKKLDPKAVNKINEEIDKKIDSDFIKALNSDDPNPSEVLKNVFR